MMKNAFAALALCALALTSCVDKEGLSRRMDGLEERISALEDAVIATNANALAASKLLKENTLILGYEKTEHGYIFNLEGEQVEIIFGAQAPGIVPMVGVDAQGNWIMSLDGGETWTKIPGASNAFSEPAVTPQVKVDNEGFWCISYDEGKTWSRILDGEGKPVSATDGKQVAGKKTFFTSIELGEDAVNITLASGENVTIPVLVDFSFSLVGYTEGKTIAKIGTFECGVQSVGVASLAVQAPSGWDVTISNTIFSVTAPAQGDNGLYTIGVIAVSSNGRVKQYNFTFTLTD
ncbi:MAG: PL29 family lyase N-terminal domain-containing protein [Candidatus Cryptobacteroides sp.]